MGSVADALQSPGRPLDGGVRQDMGRALGHDFSRVRVHTDATAAESAAGLGAAAYTVGRDIVFAANRYDPATRSGRLLLAHELGHVVQQGGGQADPVAASTVPAALDTGAEDVADRWAKSVCDGGVVSPRAADRRPRTLMPSLFEKVLMFAGRRLARRTVATVSKHIARHARNIAGRAIHSVFRNPRTIRTLIESTLREATEVAARHATAPAEQVIEEGAIKLIRQTTPTPGKFRYLVQKVFTTEIGTRGERVLRIVLDQTGRIVTAFPADRLAAIGLGVAAIETLTARTAHAGEVVREQAEQVERERQKRESGIDFWDFVPLIGDVWGGSLNEGEDQELRRAQEVSQLIRGTIADVEATEHRTLGPAERQELDQLIRAAITSPLIEDGDAEAAP
ncbi:DUF4157 domain-containing protein [Kitasatospora sp. RG8]|uniref:eCIS core domain-containing protein n=1 Tax=Kitasatospora sp. RG8 TaxID=2820815 RepID=UPI0027DBEBEF|nr:DUF4157 domain-containing protein [Kitasatospora sp. RG8]